MNTDIELRNKSEIWNARLEFTIENLKSMDIGALKETQKTLSELSLFLSQWAGIIKEKQNLIVRNYLHSITQELLGNWFSDKEIPIILARMDPFQAYMIPVPFESETDQIIACNKEDYISGYYSVAHEVGHILLNKYITDTSPQVYLKTIFAEIEQLGEKSKTDSKLIKIAQETWACGWFKELFADAFAVTRWGWGVAIHWMNLPKASLERFIPGLSDTVMRLGNVDYPPDNLRTVWMIDRLEKYSKAVIKETMENLRKRRPISKYALHPKFLSSFSLTEDEGNQLCKLIYHAEIGESINGTIDRILEWSGVGLVPIQTADGVRNLREGNKPAGSPTEIYSALLEFDGINHFQKRDLGTADKILLN